jgi:hypothetical protein
LENEVVLADTDAKVIKGPELPVIDRSMTKPVSSLELSIQNRSRIDEETGVTVRPEGGSGSPPAAKAFAPCVVRVRGVGAEVTVNVAVWLVTLVMGFVTITSKSAPLSLRVEGFTVYVLSKALGILILLRRH